MVKQFFKKYKILVIICGALAVAGAGYLIVLAVSPVTDTFTDAGKITSRTNLTICAGQIKLAESTWTTLNECNCNSLSGWYWATTNTRSACWSKTLADSVSWNKGAGDDTDNPGAYTCAIDITALSDRMVAVAAGQWYKIVSDVAGTAITSGHNGSAGYSVISALAISDCLDGTRDLCTGNDCLGADVAAVNVSLATWASATGNKSAIPYCSTGTCGSAALSDWWSVCEQNSGNDFPLNCFEGLFYKNRKVCADGDTNYTWAAAAYSATYARALGLSSCSNVLNVGYTSYTASYLSFRVVVRP